MENLDVQVAIARAVVDALPIRIAGIRWRNPLVHRSTDIDPVAFNWRFTGRRHLDKRTVPDLMEAQRLFEAATERDPGYAEAFADLAQAKVLLGAYDYGVLAPSDAFPEALRSANRALALDTMLAEAHAALGSVYFNYEYDWGKAEAAYKSAIERKRGYIQAHHWYSLLLTALGRYDEAEDQLVEALGFDPDSLVLATALSRLYYLTGRTDAAIAGYLDVLGRDPAFVSAHLGLGMSYLEADRETDAIASFRSAEAVVGTVPTTVALLGFAYAKAGDEAAAEQQLVWLRAAAAESYVPAEYFALVHIGLGDLDAAINDLYEALENRSGGVAYLTVEPVLEPLRGNPRFQELRRRMGL